MMSVCPLVRSVLVRIVVVALLFAIARPGLAAPPDATQQAELRRRSDALAKQLKGADSEKMADIAIAAKAADWALRHGEFPKADSAKHVAAALGMGEQRAAALAAGKANWATTPGTHVLGYVSEIDGSVQPYALSLPEGYDVKASKRWPLTVVLHGRNGDLTEAGFIASFNGKPAKEKDQIRLDVYGRGNNAYRWAGETDVFEAIAAVRRRFRPDDRRIVLWGFSMGGAGAWHLGLHHPDRWAAAGAGAGFVDFYGYQNKTQTLPPYQDATLSIYDVVPYALNAADVPFVTYGGDQDKQRLASITMVAAAELLDVNITAIVGKNIGHKFTPEAEREFQAFLEANRKLGRALPSDRKRIRFATCTPKYNTCGWVTVAEMGELYSPAIVEAEIQEEGQLARVVTGNVAALQLSRDAADEVELDGDRLPLRDAADGLLPEVIYVRRGDGWTYLNYDASREFLNNPERHKRQNLQGPIDDAFMQSFVCVTGDGKPWSAEHQKYADWSLKRLETEFDKYLRGRLRVVKAGAVTPGMIASSNLILFGDPGSNPLIAQLLPELPLTWTKEAITVAGTSYDPKTHAAVLIFPNPLNPNRYVVLNSGHTFHADAFTGTNALLYPRLGDFAVLKVTADGKQGYKEEPVWADIFDTAWQLPSE